MAKVFPNMQPPVKQSGGVSDRATFKALQALETWADQVTQRLSKLDLSAGGTVVGGVASVSAGSSAVSVSPSTGAVVVDVVEANFAGIPQSAVTSLVTDLASKAPLSHGHAVADVTGLQAALDGKIDEVIAGTNLSGGGTSGAVTLNVVDSPSFAGNVTLGDAVTDAHRANGYLAINGAPDSNAGLVITKPTGATYGLYVSSGQGHFTEHLRCQATLDVDGNASFAGNVTLGDGADSHIINGNIRQNQDNTHFSFDSGSSERRVGFTKKAGFLPKLTFGSAASLAIAQSGSATIDASGTFTDKVVISSGGVAVTGTLSATGAITQGGTAVVLSTRAINTTAPLSGGGNLSADRTLSISPGTDGQVLTTVAGAASWATPSGNIGGSGTTNTVPKFTAGTTIGNSNITDNGSTVTVTGPLQAGNTTLGLSGLSIHTLHGAVSLQNSPAAGSLRVGSVQARVYLGRQIFTSSGTYTPTTGTKAVLLKMVGGGGGGAGAQSTGAGNVGIGGGGWSGNYLEKWIVPAATITGGTITIGSGGGGGSTSGGNGSAGGSTTAVVQGTTYTANGGAGGLGLGAATAGNNNTYIPTPSAVTTTGDVTIQGTPTAGVTTGPGGQLLSGTGGGTPLGGGGYPGISGAAGNSPQTGYGGGGGGAQAHSGVSRAGGAGAAGLVIIEEYA
jgi:hypothetical protein